MSGRFGRRNFLVGAGLAAGSLYLPSLSARAGASPGPAPQRLIVVVSQHGGWMPTWAMNPRQNPSDKVWTEDLAGLSAADFSASLAPLHPWRERMVAIEGLSMVSGDIDPAGVLRHEIGQIHTLTGDDVEMVSGLPVGRSPSLDQLVADRIARDDRLRSIELGIGGVAPVVNYRGRLQPLVGEPRISVMHERLFGLVNSADAGSELQREQSRLLERVHGRYAALSSRMSQADRDKVEIHRSLLSDLRTQVTGLMEAECTVPPREGSQGYARDWSAATKLLTAAMGCDLVRVATLNLTTIPGEVLNITGDDIHDAFAHELARSDRAVEVMSSYYAYHAKQLAELLTSLDQIPEGGGTMLDHTMIVWTSELADGIHGFDRMPVVVFGGQAWENGRYIHYPSDTPYPAWVWDGRRRPTSGRPHQKLLSSILRAFDVRDPQTGEAWQAMPIRELKGENGAKIDCTGVLDELFA